MFLVFYEGIILLRRILLQRLSEPQKIYIKSLIDNYKLMLANLLSNSRFCSILYYCVFNSQFRREMFSVLQGRKAYADKLTIAQRSSPLLRRNIHRLEKGLIMRPRRPVFALDYIGETVDAYASACRFNTLNSAEFKWATDVLAQYFAVTAEHPVLNKERQRFASLTQASSANTAVINTPLGNASAASNENSLAVPYRYADIAKTELSFSQLSQLFKQRRSVRWFLPQAVPKELIYQAVEAASQAPSACNRQPFRFDLLLQPAAAQKVAALAMGTVGFADNIPSLLVVVGDLSCYPAERDRHVIYIDASLATMQLMLALETLGLSTCPINWPDIESRERAMAKALNLPPYERPVMLLAVGFADPAGGIAFSQKKSAELLIREVTDVY